MASFPTNGNDIIFGTPGSDNIDALAGNDTVFAGAGNDKIYGNSGNDLLYAYSGNDTLYGGTGNDTLNGGTGHDVVVGGQRGDHVEVDRLTGGAGSDRFLLGDYHSNLYSNAGNGDYARITDFQKGQDSVQLDLGNYTLGASPINGISGTAIYDGAELIGILEGVNKFNLYFDDGAFTTTLKAFGFTTTLSL